MLKCTSEQAAAELWQDVIDLLDGDRDSLAAGGLQNQETGDIETLPYHPAADLLTNKRRLRIAAGGSGDGITADGYDFEIEGSGQDDDSGDDDTDEEDEDVEMLQGALAAYYGTESAASGSGADGVVEGEQEEESLVDLL